MVVERVKLSLVYQLVGQPWLQCLHWLAAQRPELDMAAYSQYASSLVSQLARHILKSKQNGPCVKSPCLNFLALSGYYSRAQHTVDCYSSMHIQISLTLVFLAQPIDLHNAPNH